MVLVLYALGILSYILVVPFQTCSSIARRISDKLSAWIFWNALISIVFDTILIIAFVSFIKLRYHMIFDNFGETFEAWMSYCTIAMYCFVPTVALIQIMCNFGLLHDPNASKVFFEGGELEHVS